LANFCHKARLKNEKFENEVILGVGFNWPEVRKENSENKPNFYIWFQ
jgi:hypothetical protein